MMNYVNSHKLITVSVANVLVLCQYHRHVGYSFAHFFESSFKQFTITKCLQMMKPKRSLTRDIESKKLEYKFFKVAISCKGCIFIPFF